MRVTSFSTRSYDFACRSKACAPPPVGSGGSSPNGRSGSSAPGEVLRTGLTTPKFKVVDHEGRAKTFQSFPAAQRHAAGIKAAGSPKTFKVITAAEARGDSRPVSHEEFQRLAHIGQGQLDRMAADKAPTTGLDRNWTKVRAQVYAEVQQSWGGATIDAHTGHALPQGENKYAITVKSEAHSTISVHESASPEAFHAAMDRAKQEFGPLLERQSHYLGVFHDDENHRIDIDPVIVVTNRSDVDTIGAASRSIGGAYNFMDGNGYWPPHVAEG